MKKYIYFIIVSSLSMSGIFAQQKDSLLTRQMELQREFNPTLQDANKISSLPSLHEPKVKKANASYSSWAGHLTPPLEITMPRPGNIMNSIPFDLRKGYISLHAGNYANINGALGYRFIDKANQKLKFTFLHYSTNGNINYRQDSDPKSNKAYFMDNSGNIGYEHLFDMFRLRLEAGYTHTMFNYYANTFAAPRLYKNENQTLGIFNASATATSVRNDDLLNYTGTLHFRHFNNKFGNMLNEPGLGGNQLNVNIDLNKPFFGGDNKVGLIAKTVSAFYDNNALHTLHQIEASPYVTLAGYKWKAHLGGNVHLVFNGENKSYLSPDVRLSYLLTERSSIFANLTGNIYANTYLDMMQATHYLHPITAVKPAYTALDFITGLKIGEADGFRFDFFGGFKKTDDAYFLILNHEYQENELKNSQLFHVVENLVPVYGNFLHTSLGAVLASNIWSPLNIKLRMVKNFYTVNNMVIHGTKIDKAKAYNKPEFEIDLRTDFQAVHNLKFTLNYYYAGGRWTYFKGQNVSMANINDLNMGAMYKVSETFSINLQANNILFQNYDLWYGHPAQSFNMMGGFTFKF